MVRLRQNQEHVSLVIEGDGASDPVACCATDCRRGAGSGYSRHHFRRTNVNDCDRTAGGANVRGIVHAPQEGDDANRTMVARRHASACEENAENPRERQLSHLVVA
jgi:hypothetical protein